MQTSSNSFPLLPFENAVDALAMFGFGAVFWTMGYAIHAVSQHPSRLREIERHNPWIRLFKGRPATEDEIKTSLPDAFFRIWRVFGRAAVLIGYGLLILGLAGLLISLGKKLI